jgi:hypothetical protein
LEKLDGLPFRNAEAGGRYVSSGDADQCVWVDEVGDTHARTDALGDRARRLGRRYVWARKHGE